MGSTRHELGKLSARGRRCVRPAGLREGPGALRPTPGSPRKLGPSCQTRPTRTAPPHPGLRTGGRVVGAMAVCPLSWAGEAEEAPPQQVLGDEDTTARAVACGFSLAQEANICCSQEAPLRWGGGGGRKPAWNQVASEARGSCGARCTLFAHGESGSAEHLEPVTSGHLSHSAGPSVVGRGTPERALKPQALESARPQHTP